MAEVREAHGEAGHRVRGNHAAVLDPVDVSEKLTVDLTDAIARSARRIRVRPRRKSDALARGDHSVFETLAVFRKGRLGSDIVVQCIVVGRSDAHEFGVRKPLIGRNFLQQSWARCHKVRHVALHRLGDKVFGLCDQPIDYFQAEGEHDGLAFALDDPDPADLLQLSVWYGNGEIGGAAARARPEPFAQTHASEVFDQDEVLREHALGRSVADKACQIGVSQAEQAITVAADLAQFGFSPGFAAARQRDRC